ncbi:hypothetical protein Dsin_032487 [Dipteronia sinensis]|uniref:DUF4283 domain-containing protein n=1 Tax=Dipteronia sinensis TaxID=43782 RepID=A0AAD9ZNB7_9ROSI|nr:hypothetical protein Dsin_032487 [Dipteronia sinensis]
MDIPQKAFVFSAQQSFSAGVNPISTNSFEISGSAKRPRAESTPLGRGDVAVEIPSKDGLGSFKSKLLQMSNPSSWSGLGSATEKLQFDQQDIQISEGPSGLRMCFSSKLKAQLQKPWANALILKNMGRFHTLNYMISKLTQKWKLIGQWQLTDLGEGYFVARFQMKDDLEHVLTSGPWVIANQYLAVQRWQPNFVPGEDLVQSMPIWVRLSKLPLEWLDSELLWNIGGMLGIMCKVDPLTVNQARGRFARICVEIDISKPLVGTLYVEKRSVKVEYESLGRICFTCGRFSHSRDACREGVADAINVDSGCVDGDRVPEKSERPSYGPWLMVSYGKHSAPNPKGKYGRSGVEKQSVVGSMRGAGISGVSGIVKKITNASAEVNSEDFVQMKKGARQVPFSVHKGSGSTKGSGSRFEVLCEDGNEREIEAEQGCVVKTFGKEVSRHHGSKGIGSNFRKGKAVFREVSNSIGNQNQLNPIFPSQNYKNTRKKAYVVAAAEVSRTKVDFSHGTSSAAVNCVIDVNSRNSGDDEDCDSASVLRQLHRDVNNCGDPIVDPMETGGTSCIQKVSTSPVTSLDRNFELVASDLKEVLAVISE